MCRSTTTTISGVKSSPSATKPRRKTGYTPPSQPADPRPLPYAKTAPSDWRNAAVRVRRVKSGDVIAVQVEGGWVRKATPVDGIVAELPDGHEVFVPAAVLLSG